MVGNRRCSQCEAELEDDAVICVRCGADQRSGEQLLSEVGETVEDREADEAGLSGPALWMRYIPALWPGLFRPGVLVVSLITLIFAFLAMGLGLFIGIVFMLVMEGMVITGFGVVLYAQVMAWWLVGELSLLPDAMVDFDGLRWNVLFVMCGLPLVIILLCMKYGV